MTAKPRTREARRFFGIRADLCLSAVSDRCRLTVDDERACDRVKRIDNRFTGGARENSHIIVEMKYEKSFALQADRAAGFFPFRITRNSRYVNGIKSGYLKPGR